MSMLSKFLWGSKHKTDPAAKAMPYIQKQIASQQPYVNQGQQAGNLINPIYGEMAQDPTAYLEKLMANYEPSKAYQLQRDEALKGAGAAAAAGGFRGGQQDLINSTQLTNRLLGDDMQKWLQNVYGLQGAGLAGQQHIADQGFDAATNQGNAYGTQGTLAYNSQANRNLERNDILSGLLKGLGAVGGAYMNMPTGGTGGKFI